MDHARKRALVAASLALSSVVIPLTWRDLSRRPAEQIRGPRWLWRLASSNLSGSAAYWLIGRKPSPPASGANDDPARVATLS